MSDEYDEWTKALTTVIRRNGIRWVLNDIAFQRDVEAARRPNDNKRMELLQMQARLIRQLARNMPI